MAEMRDNEEFLLTISEKGFGKRSSAYGYRTTARGAKGIAAAVVSAATGPLVACFPVVDEDGLVLITDGGQAIRTRVKDVRKTLRTARGVKMFQLPNGQRIVSVAKVGADDIDDAEIVTPLTDLDGEGEVAENVE
jgi:DNA gyrase subunit A